MRSTTAGELATLGLLNRTVEWRVKVANGSGTMIDLSSWLEAPSCDTDVDQPVSGATLQFTRASGVLQTLAPFRTDSTLNVKDDLTYAPLVDLTRAVTIEAATTPAGVLPSAGDFKLFLEGTAATVDAAGNPLLAECRDKGGQIVDRWVEAKKLYGSALGVAVETVMQSILDDNFGVGVIPLYTPVSPSYLISPAYQQQEEPIMDAMVALAQNPGWDVRYKWDNGTSQFRFTLSQPPRTKTVPDYTFGPKDYFDITRLELSETDIRNVVVVSYRDSADLGNRKTITVTDSASITKYKRRPLIIIEGDNSPINTSGEATTMANAALADLKDPKADMMVTMPLFWPVEIGDLYRFSANGVHINTDLDLAVVGFTHARHETQMRLRGKPTGQYLTWLARGGSIGGAVAGNGTAKPPVPFIQPLNTEANDLTWDFRFNSALGSGGGGTNLTYTIKLKKSFASETTLDSGNASAFPRDLTVTRDPKQDAVLTFAVTDAATGLVRSVTYPIPSIKPFINASGDTITAATMESGGKPINRLFAKPLLSDPDTLDSAPDGTTYKRVVSVSSGQVTTASIANANVTKDKTESRHRCNLTHSTTQSINNNTLTRVAWDSEISDTGLHDNVTNNSRITVPAGGDVGSWTIIAGIVWQNSFGATGYIAVRILKNNSTDLVPGDYRGAFNDATFGPVQPVVGIDPSPAVGDYYEVYVRHTAGVARNITQDSRFQAIHSW